MLQVQVQTTLVLESSFVSIANGVFISIHLLSFLDSETPLSCLIKFLFLLSGSSPVLRQDGTELFRQFRAVQAPLLG